MFILSWLFGCLYCFRLCWLIACCLLCCCFCLLVLPLCDLFNFGCSSPSILFVGVVFALMLFVLCFDFVFVGFAVGFVVRLFACFYLFLRMLLNYLFVLLLAVFSGLLFNILVVMLVRWFDFVCLC